MLTDVTSASGAGSQQGNNQTEVIRVESAALKDPSRILFELNDQSMLENSHDAFFGVRSAQGKEANTAESTRAPNLPEASKGILINIMF